MNNNTKAGLNGEKEEERDGHLLKETRLMEDLKLERKVIGDYQGPLAYQCGRENDPISRAYFQARESKVYAVFPGALGIDNFMVRSKFCIIVVIKTFCSLPNNNLITIVESGIRLGQSGFCRAQHDCHVDYLS